VLDALRNRELRQQFRGTVHNYAVVSLQVHRLRSTVSLMRSTIRDKKRSLSRIQIPPGWCLHRLAAFAFSRRTFETVIEPTLSDLQAEYLEALQQGDQRKAAFVRFRGYLNFWTHILAQRRFLCVVSCGKFGSRFARFGNRFARRFSHGTLM
jgi:hypothetical protein